jgi:hypothetical protein
MPASSVQQASKSWVKGYHRWVHQVLSTATQHAASQFIMPGHPFSAGSDGVNDEVTLNLLQQSMGEGDAAHLHDVASLEEYCVRLMQPLHQY